MKSPFPGMDPFLEDHWLDIHAALCTYARDALQPQLRPALVARIDERLIVETDEPKKRQIYPDVKIVRKPLAADTSLASGTTAIADEPLVLKVNSEPMAEGFINIIDPRSNGKIITVIEFLSHANKNPGDGQRQYLKKQSELLQAGVSLVEIDLLRDGEWVLQVPIDVVPEANRTAYRVCVHRGWTTMEYEFYSIPLQSRLPNIKIPLRETDSDAVLSLQSIFDQAYQNGAYDSTDYGQKVQPPFTPEEAAWVNEVLSSVSKEH